MYCITGTRKGLVDMPYHFRISPRESWGTYFVRVYFIWSVVVIMECGCHSLAINKTYVTQSCQQTLCAVYSYILEIQKQYVWHFYQTLLRAGDAIHPVLWKRCGFQTRYNLGLRSMFIIIVSLKPHPWTHNTECITSPAYVQSKGLV